MDNNTLRNMKKLYESPALEVEYFHLETPILSEATASGATADMEIDEIDDLW